MKSFLDHEAYFNEPGSDEHIVGLDGKRLGMVRQLSENALALFSDPDKKRYDKAIGKHQHTTEAFNNYYAFKNKVISFDAAVKATIEGTDLSSTM